MENHCNFTQKCEQSMSELQHIWYNMLDIEIRQLVIVFTTLRV